MWNTINAFEYHSDRITRLNIKVWVNLPINFTARADKNHFPLQYRRLKRKNSIWLEIVCWIHRPAATSKQPQHHQKKNPVINFHISP